MLLIGIYAQTTVTKSYSINAGEKLQLDFDYPKIVKISTWDKNEVSVTAHVNINDGNNDTAFVLEDKKTDGILHIKNLIKNMDKLPRIYTVMQGTKKTIFRTKEDFKAFTSEAGNNTKYTSEGIDIVITLEIKIPANTSTNVKAKYGIVELANFNAPVNIDAPYGGIDATVTTSNTGKLQATTNYGQIYTNLDLTLTEKTEKDFFTSITSEPGKGPSFILKSTYGNVYLRKSN